jgi:hypothetical protein
MFVKNSQTALSAVEPPFPWCKCVFDALALLEEFHDIVGHERCTGDRSLAGDTVVSGRAFADG